MSEQRTPGSGTAILQTDITELIHLERQERDKLLDEQALLIRATLDHVNQGICIFDAGRRLVGWNARLRALLSPPIQLLRVGTGFAALRRALPPGAGLRRRAPARSGSVALGGAAETPPAAGARAPDPRRRLISTSSARRCPTAAS